MGLWFYQVAANKIVIIINVQRVKFPLEVSLPNTFEFLLINRQNAYCFANFKCRGKTIKDLKYKQRSVNSWFSVDDIANAFLFSGFFCLFPFVCQERSNETDKVVLNFVNAITGCCAF